MFKFIKKLLNKNGNQVKPTQQFKPKQDSVVDNVDTVIDSPKDQYISDQPIASAAHDRFNRAAFSSRIAETIATRKESSSIVIGLYGPWGDGKTSVLEMMQETLNSYPDAIVIKFNPWHFQTEELLLRGFFATMAEGLGRSLPTFKEKAGELLSKYGGLLSVASLSVAQVVQFSPGDAAQSLGKTLSNSSLDELKDRIETMLAETKKRLIIFIDDIDRLDRNETHAIFKLVKLSASFRYTAYVLAFDDEVVSASLGERYGAGDVEAGRAFLEKIIQVPLNLPKGDLNSLRALAFEGAEAALNHAEIVLSRPQIDEFVRYFEDGLLLKVETPRRAKLYSNALMFALPILKNEANPVDLMLIEGIRVFYPNLYKSIRENPDLFLNGESRRNRPVVDNEPDSVDIILEATIKDQTLAERQHLRLRLLERLFPRISSTHYAGEWEVIWGRKQKVCSKDYFKRYFSYSVPIGDISDREIADFCNSIVDATEDQIQTDFQRYSDNQSLPNLVTKIRQIIESLQADQASALMKAIAVNGELFPRERGATVWVDTRSRAAMLIRDLLKQLPAGQQRQELIEEVIQIANPIGLAMELFRWVRHHEDRPEEDRVLSQESESAIGKILASRISEVDAEEPLFSSHPKDARILYWYWANQTSFSEVRQRLESLFNTMPDALDDFLACYIGEAWGVESGLPRPSDFGRDDYDSVIKVISPEYVAANLRQRFGDAMNSPQEYPNEDLPLSDRIAHRFMLIHQYVLREIQNSNVQDSSTRLE